MDTVETLRHGLLLGEAATGTINPADRMLDRETLVHLEQSILAGQFDAPVVEGVFLPCGCIDGRCPRSEAAFQMVPNAAGGTLSLLVGELLTTETNVAVDAADSGQALTSLIAFLQKQGYGDQVGGHTGPNHGSETASGCGANDQLPAILSQMVEKPAVMAGVLERLGVEVDTETALVGMIAKADMLVQHPHYFKSGKEIAATLASASPDGNCPDLVGAHNEILIRLNTVEGTTLNRRALKDAYGDDYQVFNVDVWALKTAAETLSYSEEEAENKFAAMVMYQVATALQLCGPSMKVVVR